MNCNLHPENAAVGVCTSCGRAICRECAIEVQNKLICRECLSTGKAAIPTPGNVSSSLKDRSIAMILEILPGLFGILGIGWIYAGQNNKGVKYLIGFLAWHFLVVLPVALITASGGLCITIPIDLIIIGISASSLNSYTNQNPQLFK